MSTMVVQERHLWLNLAEMKDVDKARFLDAPISEAGLFGDTVKGFAQQFSAVQQQTEAIQHILPRRDAPSTAASGARPQSANRRGHPPASSRATPPQAESTYVSKVPTTPFCDQVVNLLALPSEEADPALALLCPVRALRIYVDRTRSFRSSDQLFVYHGGQQKGKAVSKQRLAHWIVDAVALAYQSQGEPCPLGVRAHSTRSVAASHALAHGASLADIYRAAGWATPNTFARLYSLCVEPVSSCVLANSNGQEELVGVTLAASFPLTRGYERLFYPPVQFPGRGTLVESSKHPRQSDWAEQSDARPSTGVSLPGSPVSPCTGLGVRMAWFPFR